MKDREKLLKEMIETEAGADLLYTLFVNAPDIVFALRTDAENHKRIGWQERYVDLMAASKKICRLAQATGQFEDL